MNRTVTGVGLIIVGFVITAFFGVGSLFSMGVSTSGHPGGVLYLFTAIVGIVLMLLGWWLTTPGDPVDRF